MQLIRDHQWRDQRVLDHLMAQGFGFLSLQHEPQRRQASGWCSTT
jgi:hypothetical protein